MPPSERQIDRPDSLHLSSLCDELRDLRQSDPGDVAWPREQLRRCGEYGVYRWFLPREFGGLEWSPAEIAEGYLELGAACLTTSFVLTQRTAACRRLASSANRALQERLLPDLASGEAFATVGISHLTTSHRHQGRPALRAVATDDGYCVDGFSPWVTGAGQADHLVLGAEMDDGRQILFCVPARSKGIRFEPGHRLLALTGSGTGAVVCDQLSVGPDELLAGPEPQVLSVLAAGAGGGTGGLQTSMLALGLSQAAIRYLADQCGNRPELSDSWRELDSQFELWKGNLLGAVSGAPGCSNDELRTAANSLVLRSTQSALIAAKGAGFVAGHPVGRWCREALFFLVWSCPQSVSQSALCELAGLVD